MGAEREVPASAFLLVEGITALHPDLRDRYDYRICVDAPPETARMRGAARDAGNENEGRWERWSRNDVSYATEHQSRECADAVIDNT